MLSKSGSNLLHFATYLLRLLLRIGYISATFPATYLLHVDYKTAGPASFWHQGMRLAHVSSLDDGPAPTASCQIDPGESCRTAERQASASLSYPANRQVLPNPHVGRPGFLLVIRWLLFSRRPPGPAGSGRAQTLPHWLLPDTDSRFGKDPRGPISTSGSSISVCHRTRRFLRTKSFVPLHSPPLTR
jgi:hypothetical protein